MKQLYIFGQAYGEGAYGDCTYSHTDQECETTGTGSTSGGTGSNSGSGSLVDTGVAVAFIVALACLLIFVALVVRFIRRPRAVLQEVAIETTPRQEDDERS